MQRLSLALAGIGFALAAQARSLPPDPPLPPVRPPDLERRIVEEPPAPAVAASACTARLRDLGYDIVAATLPPANRTACQISEPVMLRGVRRRGGSAIRIAGDPVLDCRMAETVGGWITEVVAPIIAEATGSTLRALRDTGGFECRNRNRRPDGKLSAHAQGLAMDLGAFELANGNVITVTSQEPAASNAIATLRRAACGWFLTVLGPGSDPDHATHLHLDLQQHGSSDRYRICQ